MKTANFETIGDQLKQLNISIEYGNLNTVFPYMCVVPVSGGKDSQTCYELALKKYGPKNVIALFCDTKFEHGLTYEHVNKLIDEKPFVILNGGSVESECLRHGRFPGGGARHCTNQLKIRPSKFFYKALAEQQGGFEVWYGIRTRESAERAARYRNKIPTEVYAPHEFMPSNYPQYLAALGVMFRLPIVDWSTKEVLQFLNGRENPLYSMGFDRVGCFPCMAGGDKSKHKAFTFDETGRQNLIKMQEISVEINKPVYNSKGFAKYNKVSNEGCEDGKG